MPRDGSTESAYPTKQGHSAESAPSYRRHLQHCCSFASLTSAPKAHEQHEDCSAREELDGALAREQVVVDDAPDGEHRKAAVLNLRELQPAPTKHIRASAPQWRTRTGSVSSHRDLSLGL
jgi:hypothetical protein